MNSMQIERCLKTEYQIPYEPKGTRRIYLLPYVGSLTKGKVDLLARNLKSQLIKDGWFDCGESMLDAVRQRLESEWFTGKEKQVAVTVNSFGNVDVEGQGWMCCNFPASQVSVLATS